MDAYEATRIVFSRIQSLEPENASKIIGYLLLQDHGEQEMIRLAFSPDSLIQSMIIKAKKDLGLMQQQGTPAPTVSSYLSRINRPPNLALQSAQISQSRAFSSPTTSLSPHAPPWGSHISQQTRPLSNNLNSILNEIQTITSTSSPINSNSNGYLNFSLSPMPDQANNLPLVYSNEHPGLAEEFQLQDQLPFLNDSPESAKSHANYLSYPEMLQAYCNGNQPLSMNHVSPTAANNCYPGTNHVSKQPSSIADIYNLTSESAVGSAFAWKPCMYFARGYCKNGSNCRFLHGNYGGHVRSDTNNDHIEKFMGSSSGPLEKLESELKELLRGRSPVSVASLPQLYSERLGKALQAERFTRYRSERDSSDHLASSTSNSGSRQIYLTFPAESTFREEDVSNYFSIFGPVQDVRIPYQQKRMFGFVTFVYQETVKIILAKGNPHYVCDARVLVKPYKEKGSKPTERMKYTDCRGEYSGYLSAHNLDIKDSNLQLGPPRFVESSLELVTRRQLEEQDQLEQAIELQTKRLAELQLADRKRSQLLTSDPQVSMTSTISSPAAHHYQNQFSNGSITHSEEDATTSEDFSSSTLAEHFGYVLQVLDSESVYDELQKPVNHHHDRVPIANGVMRM